MKHPLSLHAQALGAHRDGGRLERGEETEILFPKHSLPHASKHRGDVREQEEPALSASPASTEVEEITKASLSPPTDQSFSLTPHGPIR